MTQTLMTHWNLFIVLAKPVAADNIEDDPDMKELMQWAN